MGILFLFMFISFMVLALVLSERYEAKRDAEAQKIFDKLSIPEVPINRVTKKYIV